MLDRVLAEVSHDHKGILEVSNHRWRLRCRIEDWLSPFGLIDLEKGEPIFDEDYSYRVTVRPGSRSGYTGDVCDCSGVRFLDWSLGEPDPTGVQVLTLQGRMDFGEDGPTGIFLEHRYRFPNEAQWLEEELELSVPYGEDTFELCGLAFGARKTLFDRGEDTWRHGAERKYLAAVPFRRRVGQRVDHMLSEYSAADLIPVGWDGQDLPARAAEGWIWGSDTGGYLISKYSQHHIEFAVVAGEYYVPLNRSGRKGGSTHHRGIVADTNVCLRFAGAGVVDGSPRASKRIGFGDSFCFGATRITPFEGNWESGYETYKLSLVGQGHALENNYNPPVHWNELYNLGWRLGMNAPLQSRSDMVGEAELAHAVGASALYFDPGWDLHEGSSVWDEARLGSLSEFVKDLSKQWGLSLALHVMVHEKSLNEDKRIYRRRRNGEVDVWGGLYSGGYVCAASPEWINLKAERLISLADAGVTFFMLDFLNYRTKELEAGVSYSDEGASACWSEDHGHSVPCTLEEHCAGIKELVRRIKSVHPEVVIEQHDAVAGGLGDYLPLYYEHGGTRSYDEHWGFEYMWDPYMDLLSGKALSLYEYNLAYDIPLYLHINCAHDNENALAFWWYASTCRHLGIGGVKPGDRQWETLRQAMARYLVLKRHFSSGGFVGLGTYLHAHVLEGEDSAVLLSFNLSSKSRSSRLAKPLEKLGLSKIGAVSGATVNWDDSGEMYLEYQTSGLGVSVITLNVGEA